MSDVRHSEIPNKHPQSPVKSSVSKTSTVAWCLMSICTHPCPIPFIFSPGHPGLTLSGPDGLDEAVALCQSVQRIVALAHSTHESAESVDVVLALDSTSVLVDLGDGNLHRTVILGLDDSVGGRAFSGDVAIRMVRG